ncbi:GYD domain-containing protein [Candidatus Lucifugimonas marina]|uniref:GYD domain-containing protein n=1 Tax=Candidatus Lucifugimonas marina TaxID=3038979 RepID=A0AAJ5ZBN6_9CHLR|nr:GYD domain-containing protein [SAR202 cluster bacterium JH702]MDG0869740.1 GYD domain-containing protein [SAR202 cluster bacterium JH639]WFG34468.1 GYD domain-containing protein [SAR202 cluster bacterium JH545]WFG38397.1 GYD domain-containing protein [SAR202 cluster bacterium JH1073]
MLFFLLANLTDDGLQACVENPDAFAEACDSINVPGARLLSRYATLGQYDFVVLVEADSAQTMSRLSVVLGANAHVHVESMQAITAHLMSEREEQLIHSGNPENRSESPTIEPAEAAS